MKRTLYFICCIGFILMVSSCRKDFEFQASSGGLEFSKDTIYLDTIFANIGSSTYNLKVYNTSNDDISIPTVQLQNGENSGYRLNVDGQAGKSFTDVQLLAKDSLFIFIETTYNTDTTPLTNNEFVYTDKILFDSGTNLQDVDLVTLVKDANFIYPDKNNTTGIIETLTLTIDGTPTATEIQGRELLPEELNFTKEKPYVIYGYAAVPAGETLTIDAGARIHFHANSGLLVSEGATLNVNGALSTDPELLENEVVFEGDRLEPLFSDVPGQWGTIWLFEGSQNNTINHATIKNATVGVLSDGNADAVTDKLTITNSQIYNISTFGILGRNTSIKADNIVLNNAGQASFGATFGGKYNVTHSTIANYWNSSFRQFPALLINNFVADAENTAFVADLTEANFSNCIIYGNDNPELLIDQIEDAAVVFNFKFTNCLLRFQDSSNFFSSPNYDFDNATHYENMIFNEAPDFENPLENNLKIGEDSAANGQGNATFSSQVPNDILGVSRTTSPDLGAFQHIIF